MGRYENTTGKVACENPKMWKWLPLNLTDSFLNTGSKNLGKKTSAQKIILKFRCDAEHTHG